MAEITDFPERRDQISIVADEIGKELKEMQGSKTVGPQNQRLIEIFGGRNIPRKFTFAHMQELLKDMSPIAGDENTIFTLSQIIEEKFPGTIDKKDFADFEERFGSVLDTQNAGNLVDLPANDPGKKGVAAIRASMDAAEILGVKRFIELQQTLFPDGEIPDIRDVQKRIVDGTATFADAFVAKMYDLGVGKNDLLEQLPETQEFAKKFHKAFSTKVTEKAMNMVSYADQVRGINKYYDFDQNFFEANQLINEGRSNLSSNVISKTISPLNRSIENVRLNKLTSAKAKPGSKKLFAGNIPPEVLQTVVKQIDVIRKAEGDVAADAVLASLLGMRGEDLTGTRTTVELATRFKPQRPVYDIETGTIVNPVEEGEPGKGLKPIGDDRPLGPLMRRVYDERFKSAGPTGEIFPDMTTTKINRLINKYIYPALPEKTRKAAKKKQIDYTDMRRITAAAIANGMGNVTAADAIISHKGSDKELDAKILRAYYIDVEDVDKLSKRGVIFSMFEKMMADSLGASTGGEFAAALGYDFPDFEADYSSLDSQVTVDAPEQAQETDQRPVAEQATPEQQAKNQALRENRSRLTSAEMELQAAEKKEAALLKEIETAKKRRDAQEAGLLPPDTPPEPKSSVNPAGDVKEAAISAELLEKLKQNPIQFNNYLKRLESQGVDVSEYRKMLPAGKSGPGLTGVMTGIGIGLTGAAIVTAEDATAATSEIARDVALDVAGEAGLKSVVGRTVAGRIPIADALIPSGNMAGEGVATPAPGADPVLLSPEDALRRAKELKDRPRMDPSKGGLPALIAYFTQKNQETKAEPDDNFLTMSP